MKKLLSLLIMSIFATSSPLILLGNTQQELDFEKELYNKNDFFPINKIDGIDEKINSVVINKNNDIYFSTDIGAYVLKQNETTPKLIIEIDKFVYSIAIDSNNIVYFGTDSNFIYKLENNLVSKIKINDNVNSKTKIIAINKNNDIYFYINNDIFVLENYETDIKKIDIVNDNSVLKSISFNKNNDVYFAKSEGIFVLKNNETIPTKEKFIDGEIKYFIIDNNNNIFIAVDNDLFLLRNNETILVKINNLTEIIFMSVDIKNNVYFVTVDGTYMLYYDSNKTDSIFKINEKVNCISINNNKNNIYFGTDNGIFFLNSAITKLNWIKQNIEFKLVDNIVDSITWNYPNLFVVDGEFYIKIKNPNIKEVFIDKNKQNPIMEKEWEINIKSEEEKKEHILKVTFILDDIEYTDEIIISMQSKIILPIKKVNLNDVIKFNFDNNIGNIMEDDYRIIFSKINEKANYNVDFSQIEIVEKNDKYMILKAKIDSEKYYDDLVKVNFNIVSSTKEGNFGIELKPIDGVKTEIHNHYLGQISTRSITNPVEIFYYSNKDIYFKLKEYTTNNNLIKGYVYNSDDYWNKYESLNFISSKNNSFILLSNTNTNVASKKYIIELFDNLGVGNFIYLQIGGEKEIINYFDSYNGKIFKIWAKENNINNIDDYDKIQLNKLFEDSKNWKKLASDKQISNLLFNWFTKNGKLFAEKQLTLEQVTKQLKEQIPSIFKVNDISTANFDINKINFKLNNNKFNPNENVTINVKYNAEKSNDFILKINNFKSNSNKKLLKGWTIIGIIVGSLSGLFAFGWLFKKIIINPYILKKIRNKKKELINNKIEKDELEIESDKFED